MPEKANYQGRSASVFGPDPGGISVGHWCEPNGTCGGKVTLMLRALSSSMMA
jgi:hypothetical protein